MSKANKKRIGIDAHMLGDHSGGNETYYRNILECMVVPDELEIYVFVKKNADVSKLKDKFNIVYFSNHGATYRNIIELPLLCMKYKLDVLHVQYFIPFIRPCKTIVLIHDICFEHYKDIFTRREYIRQKLLIPYAAKKSNLIFTVSEFSKQDICRCYGINPEKVIVTYNGVGDEFRPLSEKEINRTELKNKYGIEENYILTVGNLQPRKNLVRLIKAYVLVKEEYDDKLQLVIVGKKAWRYADIFSEAKQVKNDIIFTDYVNTETLVRIYNGASCFVYPSLFEGFGIPPVEAIACGVPVTVSNTSSLPEVVKDRGIYFNPNDVNEIKNAILKQLADIDYYASEEDIESVNFKWAKTTNVIVDNYKKT